MRVVFRADASTTVGSGHVMRCLTLADALRAGGATCEFVMTEGPGDLIDVVAGTRGYAVHPLHAGAGGGQAADLTAEVSCAGATPDWLVVDQYGLDHTWERRMRQVTQRLMVIDDLANRRHVCDLLLDQNLHDSPSPYEGIVEPGCVTLLGPTYALLRPEFQEARRTLSRDDRPARRLLVSFGGSDPTGETIEVLRQLIAQPVALHVDVVIGAAMADRAVVEELADALPDTTVHVQVSTMARLMAAADLCVGAGGSTMWERCCLGLPTLMVAVVEHQVQFCRRLDERGVADYLGVSGEDRIDYAGALRAALARPERRRDMARNGMALVDGKGTDRVVAAMMALS